MTQADDPSFPPVDENTGAQAASPPVYSVAPSSYRGVKKRHLLWRLLHWLGRFSLRIVLFLLVFLFLLEVFAPSYSPRKAADAHRFSSVGEMKEAFFLSPSQQRWGRFTTKIETWDGRDLELDIFLPEGASLHGYNPLPLTIVTGGFVSPEWVLGYIQARPGNALIVYRSPRLKAIAEASWFGLGGEPRALYPSGDATEENGLLARAWRIARTNPLRYWYALHQGVHEAPVDIAEIVRWATEKSYARRGEINLVGIGTGSLTTTAAATILRGTNFPMQTVTLINPPIDLQMAFEDALSGWPEFLRPTMAKALGVLYRRLDLTPHLPALAASTRLQMLLPRNALDVPNYDTSSLPPLMGTDDRFAVIEYSYTSVTADHNARFVSDIVQGWLLDQKAIR